MAAAGARRACSRDERHGRLSRAGVAAAESLPANSDSTSRRPPACESPAARAQLREARSDLDAGRRISERVDLQRLGKEFHVDALSSDQYHSALNASLRAAGRGTRLSEMDLTATGTLSDSEIFGGRVPNLSFDVASNHDAARAKAAGAFVGIDPAMLTGRTTTQGSATGTLDLDATIDAVSTGVTLDNVAGTARVVLESATVGEVAIDRGTIDADYRNRSGVVRQLRSPAGRESRPAGTLR